MNDTSVHTPRASQQPIDGRYRVEIELARGAMGAVFRVFDPVAGKPIALKRSLGNDRKFLGMFEREYHTLRGLRHPSIIDVYDYGVDKQGAYYTMELLSGRDLAGLAPLDYRTACSHLRDVASSLGLLHVRRMLHRDLSPRNVRVGENGRCKLIDFGVLSSFGVPELVVGTPPFIAPEALHRLELDQRADLYALGALAYWLLTGRHAYPARSVGALSDSWRRAPPRPSEVVAGLRNPALPAIPAELDDLVTSLLTFDRLGRPGSAAEVIDRLNRIGDLAPEADAGEGARSYLIGVQTVGRTHEQEQLRDQLKRSVAGRGSSVLIETAAGLGSTRLISDLGVEAQLVGALPVICDAAARSDSLGTVHDLVDKLLTLAHDDAVAAMSGHEAILARFSPVLQRELNVEPDATDFSTTPSELRRRILTAVNEWLTSLCARRALVIAIDNAQTLDDVSGALFTMLANVAPTARMLVVLCFKTEEREAAASSVRAVLQGQAGLRIRLRALARRDTEALVRLWFGDVEHATRLADRLHRVSGGNVRSCSELAEHLVRTRVVREVHGAWVLPAVLDASELPAGARELQENRVRALPIAERRLAEAIAVHRGHVPLTRCLDVAAAENLGDAYALLENLVSENVIQSSGDMYALSYDAMRAALLAQLTPERTRALHLRIGALIAAEGGTSVAAKLDAGWHLLEGGERGRGAALLAEAGVSLGYSSDDLAGAVPALRAALEVYRDPSYSDYHRVRLLCPLALSSFFVDRRLGEEFGSEAVAVIERVLGLRMYARLSRFLGGRIAFFLSIATAAVRFMVRPRSGWFVGFHLLIVQCIASITSLCATAAVCMDAQRASELAERLAPFRWLGADTGSAYAYRFARLLSIVPRENVSEIIHETRVLLARLDDERPIPLLPEPARDALRAGALQLLGAMELFCTESQTLAIAARLDQTGMAQDRATADQLRLSYHALRGESKLAHSYRSRVELHAIQGGTLWLFEVWSPSFFILVYVISRDTLGLKTLAERFDRLAQEVPSMAYDAIMVRAEYHHLKGDHETAFSISRPVLESTTDRSFMGRSTAMAMHCSGLNGLGRYAEAKAILEPMIERLSDDDRRVFAIYLSLFRECAIAYAGLGQLERAFQMLDACFARYASTEQPLILGNLHGTAANIAIAAGDLARALTHAEEMGRWYRATENPVLVAQYEKLWRRLRAISGIPATQADLGSRSPANDQHSVDLRSSVSRLSQLSAEDRAELALRLLLEHVQAGAGYLFAVKDDQPSLIAPRHGEEPPVALLARISHEVTNRSDMDATVANSDKAPMHAEVRSEIATQALYVVHLLEDEGEVVGMFAAQQPEGRALRRPNAAFMQSIAAALFDASGTTPSSASAVS